MIEINLIPDVKRELLKAQRMRASVISISIITSIIAAGIVVALLIYIVGVQNVRGFILDNQTKDQSDKLAKVEDLSKILTIQNQLGKISTFNAQKNIDSRLFDVLSAVIPPAPNDVKVSQVSIDSENKTIRIDGQTRGYDSMEVFKKTLASTIITYTKDGTETTTDVASDINVTDTSYGENAEGQRVLRFTVTFAYAEDLFSPSVAGIAYKFSIDGNVTDSYLGIPKSIFTEKAKDVE